MRSLSFVLLAFLPLSEAAAQLPGTWSVLPLSPRPFARERHAMAYDAANNRTVLFGGHNGAYLNDTWVLGASGWVQSSPATSPPPRADHAMAYDPVRQRVVVIGGTNGTTLTDIWEWDGTTWLQRATNVFGVGADGSATYDPLQGGVFFNRDTANVLWNGTTATTVNVAQPQGSSGCDMVFLAAAGGPICKVGQTTYRFTVPQGWVSLGNNQAFGLNSYAIAADPVRNRVFLQSGVGYIGGGSGNGMGYTWRWAGGPLWQEVAGQPPNLYRHAMVFDAARDTFVMFGGHANGGGLVDATHVWSEPSAAASYVSYGAGCAGALPQAPRLRADPLWSSAPVLGGQFFARVDQVPPGTLVGGAIGFSSTQWSGLTLPFALDPLGMTGCTLLAAPEAMLALGLTSSSGSVGWVTAIPPVAALAGVSFFQQALALVPAANPAGIVWSNANHGVIGN